MMDKVNIPLSQQVEAHKLEAQGLRELFKLQLKDGSNTVLYLTAHNQISWGGQTWEEWPCKLTGYAQNSNGEKSRPKFTVANPEGVFSLWVDQGATDGAILHHYTVQTSDIDSGSVVYMKNIWVVNKPVSLNKNMVVLECRSTFDGHNFKIPPRAFFPPDFPHVSLR
jgi:lambda family phage minor tail protein L